MFLLNDQSSNQKYDASSKSGFLSSALVTFGVEGLRRGGSGLYPPGSGNITLPHQLCEPKPSLAVIKCLLRKENHPWLRTTGPAEGRSLWKYCKAPMVALFTVLIWFWYHLLSYPNSKTRRKKHCLLTVTAFPQAHTPKVVRLARVISDHRTWWKRTTEKRLNSLLMLFFWCLDKYYTQSSALGGKGRET